MKAIRLLACAAFAYSSAKDVQKELKKPADKRCSGRLVGNAALVALNALAIAAIIKN